MWRVGDNKAMGFPAGNSAGLPRWVLRGACAVLQQGPPEHHLSKPRLQTSFSPLRGSLPAVAPPSQEDLCEQQLALLSATKSQGSDNSAILHRGHLCGWRDCSSQLMTQVLLRVQGQLWSLTAPSRDQELGSNAELSTHLFLPFFLALP